jgi:L-alanine-DL-glutamate epimerase-like enolase superfamily enzyme
MAATWSLRTCAFTLQLKQRFTLATSTRTTTPALLVALERDGITGYGEAAMPPYLGETQASAATFLHGLDLAPFHDPFAAADILQAVDHSADGNLAAKAAFDIALHDWLGKRIGQPWHRLLGLDKKAAKKTSYTIGIHAPEVAAQLAQAAGPDFGALKVKLGGDQDRAMVDAIRGATTLPLRVDVNQGWRDRRHALAEIEWLAGRNVEFVEQPMPVAQRDDLAWLCERSPLPIVLDESCRRLSDLRGALGHGHGIVVKLMKCTGMREARTLLESARALGLSTMLSCMTETSCAISAAAQLSPLADWVDLDGALLCANDPFSGARLEMGVMLPTDAPGIGAEPGVPLAWNAAAPGAGDR